MEYKQLSQSRFKEFYNYDPVTGLFTRRKTVAKHKAGEIAGYVKDNRRHIKIDQVAYLASRLAILYVYGEMPDGFVDHINRNSLDDRIENLRIVTNAQNRQNSAYKGVSKMKGYKKPWIARIKTNGKIVYSERFATEEEAMRAYIENKKIHHPFYWFNAEHGV